LKRFNSDEKIELGCGGEKRLRVEVVEEISKG
jgi:hypothetical protein